MLDKSRKISQICPTDEWGGSWLQDGIVYNTHEEYIPHHPDNKKQDAPKPQVAKVIASVKIEEERVAAKPIGEVIEMAGEVKFYTFRNEAKKILGDTCPKNKKGILDALERKLPKKPLPEEVGDGLTWDSMSPSQVNLTAWGQGDREYIFPEVMSAIQSRYHKSVTNIADAIDFLIDEGVVEAKLARK